MDPAAIRDFCTYLHRRNYSPHTIENYGRDLRLFSLVATVGMSIDPGLEDLKLELAEFGSWHIVLLRHN